MKKKCGVVLLRTPCPVKQVPQVPQVDRSRSQDIQGLFQFRDCRFVCSSKESLGPFTCSKKAQDMLHFLWHNHIYVYCPKVLATFDFIFTRPQYLDKLPTLVDLCYKRIRTTDLAQHSNFTQAVYYNVSLQTESLQSIRKWLIQINGNHIAQKSENQAKVFRFYSDINFNCQNQLCHRIESHVQSQEVASILRSVSDERSMPRHYDS